MSRCANRPTKVGRPTPLLIHSRFAAQVEVGCSGGDENEVAPRLELRNNNTINTFYYLFYSIYRYFFIPYIDTFLFHISILFYSIYRYLFERRSAMERNSGSLFRRNERSDVVTEQCSDRAIMSLATATNTT